MHTAETLGSHPRGHEADPWIDIKPVPIKELEKGIVFTRRKGQGFVAGDLEVGNIHAFKICSWDPSYVNMTFALVGNHSVESEVSYSLPLGKAFQVFGTSVRIKPLMPKSNKNQLKVMVDVQEGIAVLRKELYGNYLNKDPRCYINR